MHINRLAPLLSATLSMVRSWIIGSSLLLWPRPFDDAHQHPRLAARHRPARLDRHHVALLALVVRVVRKELGGAANVLAVGRVLDQTLDGHGDGFVHFVADDLAGEQSLAGSSRFGRSRAGLLHSVLWCRRHQTLPPRALICASTVFTRAMFLRTFAN